MGLRDRGFSLVVGHLGMVIREIIRSGTGRKVVHDEPASHTEEILEKISPAIYSQLFVCNFPTDLQ